MFGFIFIFIIGTIYAAATGGPLAALMFVGIFSCIMFFAWLDSKNDKNKDK